ncbi:MAG: hydrolase [Christensenellaceae bacterium]
MTKEYESRLRYLLISMPEVIQKAPGIKIFGKVIKSLIFTTDMAIIKNTDADAVMAVYPFTPQPQINQAIITTADIPVMCDVGGELNRKDRVIHLAMEAEFRGASGAVVNALADNEMIAKIKQVVDIPVIVTIASAKEDIEGRIESGADILNVSGADQTCKIVEIIRNKYPYIPIMATGGPTDDTILETIECGADAITYTPPTNAEIFRKKMQIYREKLDSKK